VQAAVDGLGVALGRTRFVEADIAAGRLVVPFDVVLPADAGFYIVAPEETADTPKIAIFRDWLMASVTPGAVAPPPDTASYFTSPALAGEVAERLRRG